ncbi:MAG: NUDIX domain-containing protein [Planctomycetota bacterium]|nr:NUDIX domain-containing protein [Planctomycetota bacterium]
MTTPEQRAAFCLVCGTSLEAREIFGRRRRACPACNFIVFESTACAAGAVVVRGREVLLVRRAIDPGKGRWGFPAGFQDYGESLTETAVREVREETGLGVDPVRLLDVVLSRDNPRKLVNLVVYLARVVAGELVAADDALEARFFPVDDLPEDLAFENNRQILDRLVRETPTGDFL